MNGAHITGLGLGGLVGVILASLGKKIGLDLDNATSATLGVALVGAGLAVGHAFGSAWQGAGVWPSVRRGFFGPSKNAPPGVVAYAGTTNVPAKAPVNPVVSPVVVDPTDTPEAPPVAT